MTLTLADIFAARRRIAGVAAVTPLVPSPFMQQRTGHDFLLKLETTQPIGAFKLRGAANAVLQQPEGTRDGTRGVTCCSTGNHGRGVAYAARARGLRAVVCMSSLVPQTKIDGIEALGAEVRIVGRSQDDAQRECLRLVADEGLTEISPFDDPAVVAGQGTIGLELSEQRPDLAAILVPLSGGGLAAGIALAAKAINPDLRVIGITMDRGAAMHASIRAGHPVEVEEVASLADSLGGGIGLDNRLTFALCRDLLDATVLVTEAEIYRAMQTLYYEDRIVCEGASAVGHAAILSGKWSPPGPTATIISGRNLDMTLHADIMQGRDVTLGDLAIGGQPYAA
ncbi:MAG TPA: hydroxyectoine utilization dehydratase EutB [Thermohalobaculum sp.]|nr:hydroxyectoine utilization dehydratase EutB [Thermohalobaculum sp.]